MKIEQHRYLSPEAMKLRKRDRTPPWAPHLCELDDTGPPEPGDTSGFAIAWREADALRREIEAAAP